MNCLIFNDAESAVQKAQEFVEYSLQNRPVHIFRFQAVAPQAIV